MSLMHSGYQDKHVEPFQARDVRLDVLRIFLMLGITLLHVTGTAKVGYEWLCDLLHPCVTVFAFLSGWFGCKCRLEKFFKLYGVAIFSAAIMTTVLMHSPYVITQFGTSWLSQFCRMLKNYWFLHAYAVMMLFAPLIDAALDMDYSPLNNLKAKARVFPLILLSFGWSFASTFHFTESWMPISAGFGAYTSLTLTGTYVVARYCKWSGCLSCVRWQWGVPLFVVSCILASIKLGRYNSPVALAISALAVCAFNSLTLHISRWGRRMIGYIVPSLFSVYLLQVNDFMLPFMGALTRKLSGPMPILTAIFFCTFAAFMLCCLIDIGRRVLLKSFLFFLCLIKML